MYTSKNIYKKNWKRNGEGSEWKSDFERTVETQRIRIFIPNSFNYLS